MLSHKQFHTPSPQRIVVFLRLHQKVRAPVPFHMLKRCLESAANIPQAHLCLSFYLLKLLLLLLQLCLCKEAVEYKHPRLVVHPWYNYN